ncbi:hypothetical protein U5922_009355 [Aquicoccus sp. G2-2]|uniref:hypothetical protein n=1 Tax=Aquicoccus sp. G2-2 TaxID=3092120 RepID=UPI002AE06ED5|nr:hypothetical protein [Aquicoccus sp. G2-2]MEA1113676.1 hypothetical protein [Aquicoccus sp. G2-2]
MDQDLLVKEAQKLTRFLDTTKAAPKAVMLVISQETQNWRLWIVPADEAINKQEFYRIVAETISANGISGIDVGSVELSSSKNPAMMAMGSMLRADGIGSSFMSNNTFNGVLLPDGVVIRMAL